MTRVFDLVIRGAKLPLDGQLREADIAVSQGRITAIGEGFAAAEVLPASGLWALPGGIDSHCHIDQPGDEARGMDSWATASRAALCGGTTTVIPFAMPEPGFDPLAAAKRSLARASGQSAVDYGLHAVLMPGGAEDLQSQLAGLTGLGISSVKLFLTYEGYAIADAGILRVMDLAARSGVTLMLHAESDLIIRHMAERLRTEGKTDLRWHGALHHPAAEYDATCRMTAYAEVTGAEIVILHVSSARSLGAIALAAGAQGASVLAETCPQYLFSAQIPGPRNLFSPPARGEADREVLWQGLADGRIALWSSDHSPSMLAAKTGNDVFAATSGVPGLETRLPLLFSEGLRAGRISLQRYLDLTSGAAARRYGLSDCKGQIAPGYDADIVLWNPDLRWQIRAAEQQSKTDYCPCEGMTVTGKPVAALLRGNLALRDGEIATPTGRYLPRHPGQPTPSVLKGSDA